MIELLKALLMFGIGLLACAFLFGFAVGAALMGFKPPVTTGRRGVALPIKDTPRPVPGAGSAVRSTVPKVNVYVGGRDLSAIAKARAN